MTAQKMAVLIFCVPLVVHAKDTLKHCSVDVFEKAEIILGTGEIVRPLQKNINRVIQLGKSQKIPINFTMHFPLDRGKKLLNLMESLNFVKLESKEAYEKAIAMKIGFTLLSNNNVRSYVFLNNGEAIWMNPNGEFCYYEDEKLGRVDKLPS